LTLKGRQVSTQRLGIIMNGVSRNCAAVPALRAGRPVTPVEIAKRRRSD
jgi:hypothetical protein